MISKDLQKNEFGIASHAIIKQFIYAKPPIKSEEINEARLFENGTRSLKIVSKLPKSTSPEKW